MIALGRLASMEVKLFLREPHVVSLRRNISTRDDARFHSAHS
ncbi:hypothetical protein ALPO108162_13725 [Alicyclobacillus pomorum]